MCVCVAHSVQHTGHLFFRPPMEKERAAARQANHTSTCTRAGLTHLTIQTLVLSLPTWFSLVDEKCICIVPLLRPIRYTINLALIDRNQTAAAIPEPNLSSLS